MSIARPNEHECPMHSMLDQVNELMETLEPAEPINTRNSDIFEGVLLTAAGVKTIPSFCRIDEYSLTVRDEDNSTVRNLMVMYFLIRDLTPDDVDLFKTFLKASGIENTHYHYRKPRDKKVILFVGSPPIDDVHQFSMPFEPACNVLFPVFEAEAKRLKAEEPDAFRRYKDQMEVARDRQRERDRDTAEFNRRYRESQKSFSLTAKIGLFAAAAVGAAGAFLALQAATSSPAPGSDFKP